MRKHKFLSICASVLLSLSVLTTGVLADTAESTASDISTASDTSTSETDTTTNTVVAKSSEMGFPCDKLTDPNSASIYMVSLDTDTVVYTYNPDERRPMASMTKIMTYIVTAETVSDLQNTRTTVPESVAEELEGTGSSLAEIQTGESFTIYELLNLMMVPSGNDAALTLAKYVDSLNITADDPQYDEDGDGKMSCVELMNKKAAELGCTNTHFVNPNGLNSDQQYTTCRDMAKIALATEENINYRKRFKERDTDLTPDVTNAISHATCTSAHDLGAAAILTVTKGGGTARMISKYRPSCPIICCTTDETVCRQLNLSWGVIPLMIEEATNTDDLFERAVQAGEDAGLLHDGELVVMTAGVPLGISGTTNLMKVHVVGHILVTGRGVTEQTCCGSLCVCRNGEEALRTFQDGDILVIAQTSNTLLPLVRKASGLILEDSNPNGHGAIAGMSLNIPVIIGAENATRILKSGAVVTLDAERGMVSCNSTRSM